MSASRFCSESRKNAIHKSYADMLGMLATSGRKRRIEYLARHLAVLTGKELKSLQKAADILDKALTQWV